MATRIEPTAKELYEEDFYVWAQNQAELLRAKRFDELDLANLIEEVEDLGGALERSVRSRARTIMGHLLQHSPAQDPRLGWRATVRMQRSDLLNDLTPSLRRHLADNLPELYARARHAAERLAARLRRRQRFRRAAHDVPVHPRSDHRRLGAVSRPSSRASSEPIGFIGLGQMGGPMSRRLLAAGHRLLVHDVRAEAVDALVAEGAEAAGSPAEVAARAEVVLASLPTPQVVREVALGPGGLIHGGEIRTYVDLSTTGQAVAIETAAALAERRIVTLDAPVSGGVRGAGNGTLAVMVAGPATELERLRSLLEVFGRVFHVGERPGLGQLMKLANNYLSATAIVATAEAVVLGVKGGLDPATMLDVINASTGRNTASEDKFPRQVLSGNYAAGFTTGLLAKDLGLCAAAAQALGVPMPLAAEVHAQWQRAVAELGADADITTIVKCVERTAGVTIGSERNSQGSAEAEGVYSSSRAKRLGAAAPRE